MRSRSGQRLMFAANNVVRGGPPGTPNPSWANVLALLHMNGTNGATTFTDEKGHTFSSTATLDTTTKKFGTAGGFFSGAYSLCSHADFVRNTGDFTIEFWFYPRTSGGAAAYQHVVSLGTTEAAAGTMYLNHDYAGRSVYMVLSGPAYPVSCAITRDTWQHIALTRQSGVFRMFLNGALQATSSSYTTYSITANQCRLGNTSAGNNIYANLDDFRFASECIYTADFTVPSAEFPNS